MNLDVDRSAREAAGVPPRSDGWTLRRAYDDDGSLFRPRTVRYSPLTECECPDDCLRDHENE